MERLFHPFGLVAKITGLPLPSVAAAKERVIFQMLRSVVS